MIKKIYYKIIGKRPKFGPQILMQHSWVEKQMIESVWKRNNTQSLALGEVKEQDESTK